MGVQSGRTSATALVPETTYGVVPRTGQDVGISGTNPLRAFIVEPGGGYPTQPEKEVGRGEVDGTTGISRAILTGKKFDGKDSFKVDAENIMYPATGLLSIDLQEQLVAASGGQPAVYKHRLRRGKFAPSYTQVESFGTGAVGRLSSGIIFNQLDFTFGKIVMASLSMMAAHQIPNTYPNRLDVDTRYDFTSTGGVLPIAMGGDDASSSPISIRIPQTFTYVDIAEAAQGSGPFVWGRRKFGRQPGFAPTTSPVFAGTYATVNGVAYDALIQPGSTLSLKSSVEMFQVGNSGFDYIAPCINEFEASGKLDILFTDNTISQSVLDNSKIGLCFRFVGVPIGTTGQFYEMEVYLPKVDGLSAETTRGNEAMRAGGDFVALVDPTKADQYSPGGYEVQITLYNTFDTSSLGGAAGSGGQQPGAGGRQVFPISNG